MITGSLKLRKCVYGIAYNNLSYGWVNVMRVKEAVVDRFKELCRKRNIKYNELATISGVTPSTVYSMMDAGRKDVSMITVKKLCDGLELGLDEFFDADIFRELEQEIE